MRKSFFYAAPLLLALSSSGAARAQIVPVFGIVRMAMAEQAARKAEEARCLTTATYNGQTFLMRRTPADLLVGDAAPRIEEIEQQLALCHTALLADSTAATCPPARQALLRAGIRYVDLNRPTWNQQPYRRELKFYEAEDARRRKAAREAGR